MSGKHGSAAFIVARFSDRMPASIRSYVGQIVTQARTDAQSMRENRPTPPTGGPGSIPTPPAGPFGG